MKKIIKNKYYKYEEFLKNGLININNQDFEKAKDIFLKAIKNFPNKYESYINLSNVFILEKNYTKSINILKKYLKKDITNYQVLDLYSKICLEYKFYNELYNFLKFQNLNIIDNAKEKFQLYYVEGIYHNKINNYKKSIDSYINSINCNKNFAPSYFKLLDLLENTNDLERFKIYLDIAKKNLTSSIELNILNIYESLFFNRSKQYQISEDIIFNNNLIEKFKNKKNYYIKILDINLRNNENLLNYSKAFNIVNKRNNLIQNLQINKNFNRNIILETIKKYKNFYIQKNILHVQNIEQKPLNFNLVFLVGFPRSGTTLLDTILRSHSKITVLEEKPYLLECRHEFFKNKNNNLNSLKEINSEEKNYLRKKYIESISKSEKNLSSTVIDKLPLSIIEIGFIKSIFPESKIILALRHPCDVVISCFFSLFKINDAMINFLKIENTIEFYNEVFELFEFYSNQIKLNYIKSKYEDLIFNFDKQILIILNFLNLEFEKEMRNFYLTAKNREKISTPSYRQVINPLYKTSINRWKNYSKLTNLEESLEKWIKKFNY